MSKRLNIVLPDTTVAVLEARTLLRGIRVASAEELKARIELYLQEVNETPVVYRWKYKLETLSVI